MKLFPLPLVRVSAALFALAAAAPAAWAEPVAVDEAGSKLWVKADSGPKWGQKFQIGEERLKHEDGTFTVDLSGLEEEGFRMAVLTLVVSEPELSDGTTYRFSMEAKGGKGAGAILQLPEDSGETNDKGEPKPKGKFFRAGGNWPEVSETFLYDTKVKDGNVLVFFPTKQAGNVYEFRALSIEPAGAAEPSSVEAR